MEEITLLSYWEHFKAAKDLALVYPPDHPKRVMIENELRKLAEKLNK